MPGQQKEVWSVCVHILCVPASLSMCVCVIIRLHGQVVMTETDLESSRLLLFCPFSLLAIHSRHLRYAINYIRVVISTESLIRANRLCRFTSIAFHCHISLFVSLFFSFFLRSLYSLHVWYLDECISTTTHELKSLGLRGQTSQVLQNCALILKINRAENQRRCGGKKSQTLNRADDGEEAWNVILCYQNNITCIVEAPLSHGLTLGLISLLESSVINHRDWRACEGIICLSLIGQLSQDVCPPVPISVSPHWPIYRTL